MNEKLNMDKSIREKLDGFPVAPPAHVWNNIQGEMAAWKRKKRVAFIAWTSAAAVVAFAFIAGWFFNEQSGEQLPVVLEQEIVQTQKEISTVSKPADITELKETNVLVAVANEDRKRNTNIETSVKVDVPVTTSVVQGSSSLGVKFERMSYDLLERLEAIFTVTETDVYLAEYNGDRKKTEVTITQHDKLLIAENVRNISKQVADVNGWIVGAHLSPGYSSQSVNHDEQYAQKMTYSGGNGGGNVGGGLSVQYKTGKRLRVESGIYYSQNGQSSNNSLRGLFRYDLSSSDYYAGPENVNNVEPGFSNIVQLDNDGIAMNSTAGVIKMRSTPKGAIVATNAELSNTKYANTLNTDGEFSQVFEFVEIPFYVRYSVLDKRFGIEVMGGLNAGLVVGNRAYINNNYGKQNIGSTADISTVNLSGTVGVGMNYLLGKHLSLAVEPRFNYYLNSINFNPEVNFRPYRIGVFTGFYYEF